MYDEFVNIENLLSDKDLDTVMGGISDAAYAAIKKELDVAANKNDYNAFSAIVIRHTATYGQVFLEMVARDYTQTGFLTSSRFSNLVADVLKNT